MKKIILDMDVGIDDTLAIAYLLAHRDVELIGITTVFGNVKTETSLKNSLAVLELFGREDVPVFLGNTCVLTSDTAFIPHEIAYRIHGQNGIGNLELPEPKRSAESMPAVDFILESAQKYGEDLILIPTGPLTNIAQAILRDEEAMKGIGNITFMGGALTVQGNVTPYAEANIYADPEAAKVVLESEVSTTMVGLDVTLRAHIGNDAIRSWGDLNSRKSQIINAMAKYYFTFEYNDPDNLGGAIHDPLAVEAALHPESIRQFLPINLTVETQGPTRGRTVSTMEKLREKKTRTQVCLNLDGETFVKRFADTIREFIR